MLTGKHIVFIGGDARQIEVIRKLLVLDAKVTLVGFEQLENSFIGAAKKDMNEINWQDVDAIILPVYGTTSDGHIESIFSDQLIHFSKDFLKKTPTHCVVYTGISNKYLDDCINSSKRTLVRLMDRDDVAIYNSIPTVEGTIMMAIQHMDITIHGSKVVVIGLGRVGMSVARAFHALGAHVSVVARRSDHLARITEMGLTPYVTSDLKKAVKDIDLCINTVPKMMITADVLSAMPLQTLIIDLASKPGGTDFRYAEKRGMKAMLAPSLPGIVAPKTAGQILANVLAVLIKEI